jgi:hypothetical protein
LVASQVHPSDVYQGYIKNCWLCASLAALALQPDRVINLFTSRCNPALGFYEVRFNSCGRWKSVSVDDSFPLVSRRGLGATLICSRPAPRCAVATQTTSQCHADVSLWSHREGWVMLLEKAFAKAHGGYSSLQNGYGSEALQGLTGFPAECFPFSIPHVRARVESGEFSQFVRCVCVCVVCKYVCMYLCVYVGVLHRHCMKEKFPVVLCSGGEDVVKGTGLSPKHYYTVLTSVSTDDGHVLKLRNPWYVRMFVSHNIL